MKGIPHYLNTKEDVLTCHSMALAGELDTSQLKKKLQDLFSDEFIWSFESEVSSDYVAKTDEKVMLDYNLDGQERYVLYRLISNPNARYITMGFEKAELQALIDQL